MIIHVKRSIINGKITAPPSKSYTHRALVCSALARGESVITSPLHSEDTIATGRALKMIGVKILEGAESWTVSSETLRKPASEIFCGESGTTLRFMTAVCSLLEGDCTLVGGHSLSRRPVGTLLDGLSQMGVDCSGSAGFPPVLIRGRGKIRGGRVSMRGDISSQFVSAILLIAPFAVDGVSMSLTTPLESKPYVSMTMDVMRGFGVEVAADDDMKTFQVEEQAYKPTNFAVEGDWSSASYLLAAGALGGEVIVEGLNLSSLQADAAILRILSDMGVELRLGEGRVRVKRSDLSGIEADLTDCPDLFPIVAALCATADGDSVLTGVERLRYKESDRIAAMSEGLEEMGIKASYYGDNFVIHGGAPKGGVIDPKKDHRIAMAFTALGLATEGKTSIMDAECVSKSYPDFYDVYENLGADLQRDFDG